MEKDKLSLEQEEIREEEDVSEPNVKERKSKTPQDFIAMFRKAMDYDQKRFDEYIENMAFYEGKQNFLSQYAGEKPWVVDIDTTYAADAIDLRVASLLANDYKGEIEPLSPKDVQAVNGLNAIYSSFWDEMNMDKFVTEAITEAAIVREAYTHIVLDAEEMVGSSDRRRTGKLYAYPLETSSVLIDPSARGLKDADYVIVRGRITKTQAKDIYDYDHGVFSDQFTPEERGELKIDQDYSSEQEDVLLHMYIYEVENKGTRNQKIYKTVMVGNQIVVDTEEMMISKLPIAQMRWIKRSNSPYGISLMDRLIAQQKAANASESAITNSALQFAAPSLIVNEDSGLNPDDVAFTAGMPAAVYPVSGVQIDNAIRPLFSGKAVDGTMLNIKDSNVNTIYNMAGITPEFRGELGTGGNTSGGSQLVVQRSKIMEQKVIANIEEYVEDLTGILIEFITKGFAGEMIYTSSGKQSDGQYKFGQVQVPEVDQETFDYRFSINLDVKTPYSKDQNKALMLEIFQMERQYNKGEPIITNVLDVLKQYNVPEREELMDRYKKMITKDDQRKAQIITEMTAAAERYGIDQGLLQSAILEVISSAQETPALDQMFQMMEQAVAQEEQQAVEQARTQMPPTGNEELSTGEGTPVTGDEVFSLQ